MEETGLLRIEDLSHQQLTEFVSGLIDTDFSRLVQLLYRMDVSEEKLRTALLENPTGNSAEMIASLIFERITQREKAKKEFSQDAGNIPDSERW